MSSARRGDIAVIIPVFGRDDLTHALVHDVDRELGLTTLYIIDNGGDYASVSRERVTRPGTNIGWLRGCNLGLRTASEEGHQHFVLLNNDTRLSPAFFAGLRTAASRAKAGVVGPCYDDWWKHQLSQFKGAAADYTPVDRTRKVPFVDGTCIYLEQATIEKVGLLDDRFAGTGWGADIDLCTRARRAGIRVAVTELSFLNHLRAATAATVHADYGAVGGEDFYKLEEKWGPRWRKITGLDGSGAAHLARRVMRGSARRIRRLTSTGQ